MVNLNNLLLNFYNEYALGILFLNIFTYLLLLIIIFNFIFLLNLNNFKTINQFKNFYINNFITMSVILSLLSLAGMPPLIGFVGKFVFIIFLFFKTQYFFFILFFLVNIFMIYFYIQNVKFTIKKDVSLVLTHKKFKLEYFTFICFVNCINLLGIFFFNDFLIIFNYYSSFLNIE